MSRLTINGLSRPGVAPVHLSRPAPGIIAALFCGYFAVGLPLPVIVISASEDARDVREALAKGALGYVPKSASQHTLLSAIRPVLDGDLYVPPLILGEVPLSPAPDPRGRQPRRDRC
jgi:two-component system, NarL family, nitrate/nitrite response regulator NarL